jgi:iron complex outermembrane receptor protein
MLRLNRGSYRVSLNAPEFIGQLPVPATSNPNGSTFGPFTPTTCDGIQYQIHNQWDLSGEVRLASNGNGPFQWQVGGYFLHLKRFSAVALNADTGQGRYEPYNGPD